MKLLASDFDGTLCQDGVVSGYTLGAIKKWRDSGNQFGIVTGRDLRGMLHPIKEFNIPVDFLICATGASIYDGEFNAIYQNLIAEGKHKVLKDLIKNMDLVHILFSGVDDTYFFTNDEHRRETFSKNYGFIDILDIDGFDFPNLYQISVDFHSCEECVEAADKLRDALNGLSINRNHYGIDITEDGIDKRAGIYELLSLNNWQDLDVFVVGDNDNDVSMIREFKGYSVNNALEHIKAMSKKVYPSVGDMIYDII